jgi:hypothetical protein
MIGVSCVRIFSICGAGGVEQAQSYTFKAVITVIVTGFVGAVWLGIKATLGK